uniref:Uncharacterized protein n=1 Tax=Anguilla anguilla TaxID=7936 RepID=A0A0E9QCT2_ANGAN
MHVFTLFVRGILGYMQIVIEYYEMDTPTPPSPGGIFQNCVVVR